MEMYMKRSLITKFTRVVNLERIGKHSTDLLYTVYCLLPFDSLSYSLPVIPHLMALFNCSTAMQGLHGG